MTSLVHSADVDIDLGRGLAHAKEWLENNVFRPGHKTNQALVYAQMYHTRHPAAIHARSRSGNDDARRAPCADFKEGLSAAPPCPPKTRPTKETRAFNTAEVSVVVGAMPVHINSPGWKVTRVAGSRGLARSSGAGFADLPPDFLAAGSRVVDEVILEPEVGIGTRAASRDAIDLTCDVRPGHTAAIAVRMPSGALTFHRPVRPTPRARNRAAAGKPVARFRVTVRPPATGA